MTENHPDFQPINTSATYGNPDGKTDHYGNMTFPFAPLEKYAFPGGYEIFAVMDDGEILCADCVNDPTNPVHFSEDADGWRIEGIDTSEGFDLGQTEHCAHCNKEIG